MANYLDFDAKSPPYCAAPDGRRDYCGPEDFPAQPDRLYRNNGNGTFTEVSRLAGIDQPEGRGLGVLIAELTGTTAPISMSPTMGRPAGSSPTAGIFDSTRSARRPAWRATARVKRSPAWVSPPAT